MQPQNFRKLFPVGWLLSFWTFFSAGFLYLLLFSLKDERTSPKEWLLAILIGLVAFIFSLLIFSFIKTRRPHYRIAMLLTVIGSVILVFGNWFDFPSEIFLLTEIRVRILDLEPHTQVEMDWAFWAEPATADELINGHFRRLSDISYSDFIQEGSWEINGDGVLVSTEKDASLTLRNIGLHTHVPVICMKSANGTALILLETNGGKTFYALNGTDKDPLIMRELHQSQTHQILSRTIIILACAGLLLPVFLLLFAFIRQPERHA